MAKTTEIVRRIWDEEEGVCFEVRPDQDELPLPPDGHPLHELGKRLAHYLDDDKFNECERLLLEGWDHDKIDRKTGQHWRENSRN